MKHTRVAGLVIAWLALLALSTHARTRVWHDDLALWTDAVAKAPLKLRPQINRGRALELVGRTDDAAVAYRTVIGLSFDPRRDGYQRRFARAAAETNLAHLEMKVGHLATAMRMLDSTLETWPTFPYAHYNRAAIFWTVGACDLARTEYRVARVLDPTLAEPSTSCPAQP